VNEFYCKFIKKPFDKRGLSKLRMSEKGLFKNQNKQTNKQKKEAKKVKQPHKQSSSFFNPRNGHQMEVRQEMSCVNKTNKASEVKQEML
jgi:hypothetical protein